jgi:pantoate--beta-alanine ligase
LNTATKVADVRLWRGERPGRVGLVPTMGSLHAGHLSLVAAARAENDRVAVTLFVNPTQFGAGEDFTRYPRDLERDRALLEQAGCDLLFAPAVEEMYPPGAETTIDVGAVAVPLEGQRRPGHFRGVATVVMKLLQIATPDSAYFGEKDAQQLYLVRRMATEEPSLGMRIVGVPTLREPDGLARSSRNAYLGAEERVQATCLFLALTEAAERARAGERDANVLVAVMAREIGATPLAKLDYAAVVDEATFEPVGRIDRAARAIVAARFTSARLIDNLRLPEPDA